jgi:hypothetical protein
MGTAKELMITSWPRELKEPPLTIAVPGLKLTGWWPLAPPDIGVFEGLRSVWPKAAAQLKIELDVLEDSESRKHQVCAYIRIHHYPERWLDVIRDSLKYFVDHGAAIAWAGGWECFLQYSVAEKFAGCYAAYTVYTGLICFSDLNEQIVYLDQVPNVAERLHAAVRVQQTRRAD